MDNYEEIISNVVRVLGELNNIEAKLDKISYIKQNSDIFRNFIDKIRLILRKYQFQEVGNDEQNEKSEQLNKILCIILESNDIGEKTDEFEFIKSDILDELSLRESFYASDLQILYKYNDNIPRIKIALQYMQKRANYIEIINNNTFYNSEEFTKESAQAYINNNFEERLIGNALKSIVSFPLKVPRNDIIELIKYIDLSGIIPKIIGKDMESLSFFDKDLINQYCESILKLKSIFTPKEIQNDCLVQQFWNGNIKKTEFIENIVKNISLNNFFRMILSDKETKESLIFNVVEHFKSLNFSDKNIQTIVRIILDNANLTEIARFLTEIDIPDNAESFLHSKLKKEYSWINTDIIDLAKDKEKNIENGQNLFLPASYYIKKLNGTHNLEEIPDSFFNNLRIVLNTDFFLENEKEQIRENLKKIGKDLTFGFQTEEKVMFDEKDSAEDICNKTMKAYFNGQTIPIEISKRIIKEFLKGEPENPTIIINSREFSKTLLMACIQSITNSLLAEKGINIENKVFFGISEEKNGEYAYYDNYIWFNIRLLENFFDEYDHVKKIKIFEIMFHEMQHAIQYNNIEKGKIDYLTYNYIKEEIIIEYDESFYESNYDENYMEADARKEELIGALKFLKEINPHLADYVGKSIKNKYINEMETYTIYDNSKKIFNVGQNTEKIDISLYLGYLIKCNPKILEEFPILNIEYYSDGSLKNIETLYREFNTNKKNHVEDFADFHSIYYGLIKKRVAIENIEDEVLKKNIEEFLKDEKKLVTPEMMQICYSKYPLEERDAVYRRLFNIQDEIKSRIEEEKQE